MALKKGMKNLRDIIDVKVGQEVLRRIKDTKNSCDAHGPIMLPPIPDSKYIDILPEGIPLEGQNAAEKESQDGYEAEVKVYRCFESLDRDIVVLHQLEYSHEQYSAFIPGHICQKKNCRKMCGKNCVQDSEEHILREHPCHNPPTNIEGECDFVAIGSDFVAVFEVKGLQLEPTVQSDVAEKMFHGCCNDALKQRKRMTDLLTSIDSSITIHEFTVLSNIIRRDTVGSQTNLVFKDDLDNFVRWFDVHIPLLSKDSIANWKTEKLMQSLLGLWCINIDNKWDFGKFALTRCIKEVNDKLLKAHVTRKSIEESQLKQNEFLGKGKQKKKKNRKYPENELIRDASEIFSHYLNIDCLTSHQQDIFDSNERLLWVDGPAGSGKTVVLLGKVMQFAFDPINKSLNRKAVMVLPDYVDSAVQEYHYNLFNSLQPGLCETISANCDDPLNLISQCSSSIVLLKTRFMGVDSLIGLLCSLTKSGGHHIFFDDLHFDIVGWWAAQTGPSKIVSGQYMPPSIVDMIYELLMTVYENQSDASSSVWIFCDLAQQAGHTWFHQTNIHSKQLQALKLAFIVKTLSVNLRNTCDISMFLSVIRQYFEKKPWYNLETVWLSYFPKQQIGHYHRATKPVIYLIEDEKLDYRHILIKELQKLAGRDSCLDLNDVGILYSDVMKDSYAKIRSDQGKKDMQKTSFSFSDNHHEIIAKTVDELVEQNEIKGKINVESTDDCRSMEWAAVIAILIEKVKLVPALYLAASRARVYCSIIIVGNAGYNMTEIMKEIKEKPGLCKIVSIQEA